MIQMTPKERAEYKARVRAMKPDQLAKHRTRMNELSSAIAEDAINYAAFFLWSNGICTKQEIPDAIRRIVPAEVIQQTRALAPSRKLGGNSEFAEYISKHYEILITLDVLGWRGAGDILCDFAERLMTEEKKPPLWLQQWLIWAKRGRGIKPGRKKGRDPYENVDRDYAIAIAVREVVEIGGFRPTRNAACRGAATATECGCSIVAKALEGLGVFHMSEDNVAAIWRASDKGRSILTLAQRPLKRLALRDA